MSKNLFEKTVSAAKDSAKNIKKGVDNVDLEKNAKNITEMASDAKDILFETGTNVKEKAVDLKDELLDTIEKYLSNRSKKLENVKEDAVDFASDKYKDAKKKADSLVKDGRKKADSLMSDAEDLVAPKKNNTGKILAGLAIATAAAAATSYYIYRRNKDLDTSIKAEFSEKLKKWSELEKEDIEKVKNEIRMPMKLKPAKVYHLGDNAEMSEDIIVNISKDSEDFSFDPENKSEAINPIENVRKKAEELSNKAGMKIKDVSAMVSEKAMELKDAALEKKNATMDKVEEHLDEKNDVMKDLKADAEDVRADIKEEIENKMEIDPKDDLKEVEDNFSTKCDCEEPENKREWHEEKSVLMQKGEELASKANDIKNAAIETITKVKDTVLNKAADAKDTVAIKTMDAADKTADAKDTVILTAMEAKDAIADKATSVKETVTEKLSSLKSDAKESLEDLQKKFDENAKTEIYNVVIHNKGNKDYYFSPLLIQRYSTSKRVAVPTPVHEEGTTLAQRIIKPGETYTGKIAIKTDEEDDAIVVFEDLMLTNSVAFIKSEEISDEFINEEMDDMKLVNEILTEDTMGMDAKDIESKDSVEVIPEINNKDSEEKENKEEDK